MEQAKRQESLGEYRQALQTLRSALNTAQREPVTLHQLGATLNNLGGVLISLGEFVEAENTLARSLQMLQGETPGIEWTWPLNHLAMLYRATGRPRDAEAAHRRALEARQRTYGENHPAVGRSHGNLGAVLIDLRRFDEAEDCLGKALRIFRASPGMQSDEPTVLVNLAVVYTQRGDLPGARTAAEEAVQVLERTAGVAHPSTGQALLTLGRIRLKQRHYEAAQVLLGKSAQILSDAFPAGHALLADALFAHAETLRKCGEKRAAKELERKASAMVRGRPAENMGRYRVSVTELKTELKASKQ